MSAQSYRNRSADRATDLLTGQSSRAAAFNWPEGEQSEPEVIEEYTYQNVKINVGLTDKDFDFTNPDYNFHK